MPSKPAGPNVGDTDLHLDHTLQGACWTGGCICSDTFICLCCAIALLAVPEGIQHFMELAETRFSCFMSLHKHSANNLAFVAFFISWIKDVIAIEHSLVMNFGYNVKAQNDWGFGQVSVVSSDLPTLTYVLFSQILSFVLLYPVLEALWLNIVSLILFPTNQRTGISSGQMASPAPTGEGHGEQVDNVQVDDEKDMTQLASAQTHWHYLYHPLRMPFNGSKLPFKFLTSFSTVFLSHSVPSSNSKSSLDGMA